MKEKPPLLSLNEIRELLKNYPRIKSVDDLNKMFQEVAHAQREADIKFYSKL